MRRWSIAVLVAAGLLLVPAANAAADTGSVLPVTTRVDPCVPVDLAQFNRLLQIELRTSAAQGAATPTLTEVSVSCGPAGIMLQLQDGLTRKSMARVLPAESFRDASSTRLLALAVAEFVVASWVELTLQPEPAVEPVGPRPPPQARQAVEQRMREQVASPEPPSGNLSLTSGVQLWSEHNAIPLGLGLRILQRPLPELAWTVSADLALGRARVDLGQVEVGTGSLGAALAYVMPTEHAVFYIGPGARLGLTRMQGSPDEPQHAIGENFSAPFGGPVLFGRAEFWVTEALRLAVDLEGGIVTLPARAQADGMAVLALDGPWLCTALALGIAF